VLNLANYLDRRPGQLSGGQRQRGRHRPGHRARTGGLPVRRAAVEPRRALRVGMRLEISELHQSLKTTMIYVTHDQVEAMTMADKIVVLNAGNIEQVGAPLELYNNPATCSSRGSSAARR
jgi:multiple sugar transport system ATP-binding protein